MRIVNAFVAVCLAATVTACGSFEEGQLTSRSMELTDGQSTVTVIVSAENEADLDAFDLAGLRLSTGEGGIEAALDLVDMMADEESPRPRVRLEVVEEQLAEGVDTLDIVETTAPTWRAPFMWRYSYSYDDCTNVTRQSFWHKVYVSIWSKENSGSAWSSMVRDRKLSNGETLSRCDDNSYRLKVGVEARNTNHYAVEFTD